MGWRVSARQPPLSEQEEPDMTIKLGSVRADLVKEQEGDAIAIPDLPGVTLRVRSLHYQPFIAARDLASRRLAKKYGDAPVPEEEFARVYGALYAEHLLLGWDGFDQPYTPELAAATLTDPAYRDLRSHVAWCSAQVGRQQVEFLETERKNSAPPSVGT